MLRTILLFFIGIYSFLPLFSQKEIETEVDSAHFLNVAREVMNDAGLCALITYDNTGKVNVRTMQPFPPEEDLTVWFGTNTMSRKVQDVRNNPDVVLYYESPDASGYVVLYGRVKLVNDKNTKTKYWMESWEDFYEKDRSNYLLIKFIPETIEVLSTKHGINGDPVTWKVPCLELK